MTSRFTTFKKYYTLTSNGSAATQTLKTNPKALVSFIIYCPDYLSNQTIAFNDSSGKPVYGPLKFNTPFKITETFKDWYSVTYTSSGGTIQIYVTEIIPSSDEAREVLEELSDENITAGYISTIIVSPVDASGNVDVDVQTFVPTMLTPQSGTASIATANTAVALESVSTPFKKAIIVNTSASDTIKIGTSSSQFIPLAAGASLVIDMPALYESDLSKIYFVGATTGDSVAFMWW